MSTINSEIRLIRERLDELVVLSKSILNALIGEEEPLPGEENAIKRVEELASEEELIEALREWPP